MIRIALAYRGRAVPIVWKVLEHQSATVAFDVYKNLIQKVQRLLPKGVKVVLLADRGFADTDLMDLANRLSWHFRIRIKKDFRVYREGRKPTSVGRFGLRRGCALFLHQVYLTNKKFGPVHLALGHSLNGELWYVVSSEPTSDTTFCEYELRVGIEENFLDDKSNGFQLESCMIRCAEALCRLCFVIAVATLYLVSCGTQVVATGKRRWVDPHWKRGTSYLRIGWRWVKSALVKRWSLYGSLVLDGQPAIACKKHAEQKFERLKNFNEYVFST